MSLKSIRAARGALLALGLALTLIVSLQVGLASASGQQRTAEPPNYADVVIDYGDGRLAVHRVTFVSPTISSLQALQLSGVDAAIADFDFGAAVCGIGQIGCTVDNCFCDANQFWGLFRWNPQDGQWIASQVGAAESLVNPGDVDAWHWGPFESTPPALAREFIAAQGGLQWLRSQQAVDGSFGGNVGATLDTLLAGAVAGDRISGWRLPGGASAWGYVRKGATAFVNREESPASAGKLALTAAAAGLDPHSFAGQNLVVAMSRVYTPTTGAFGNSNWDQAFNMLGWRAAGETIPITATRLLAQRANADGGWGWTASSESDVDSTALAVQALLAAGEPITSSAVISGLAYMRVSQNPDGGFPYTPESATDTSSNANSTAFAVQAILAAGQDPLSAAWTTAVSATTPISFLLGQQQADGGFAFTTAPANDFATRQVVPALLGKTLLIHSPAVARREALDWTLAQQQPDGSFAGFNPGATIDAVLALAAAGRNPTSVRSADGLTALDYLAAQAADYAAQGASAAGKLAVGVASAGLDPRDFGSLDLAQPISATFTITDGRFGGAGSIWDQAWSLLGLRAAGATIPLSATQALEAMQLGDGGWGFDVNAPADVDSTALALQALHAAGRDASSPAVQAGLAYLRRVQTADGGFPGYDGLSSASSTGLAMQALAAFGQQPASLSWTRTISDTDGASRLARPTPLDALLALQSVDGGFAGFSGANDPFSTYQALPGLIGKPYASLAASPALVAAWLEQHKQNLCSDQYPWARLSVSGICR
jgi:prenyltransferase beta subunit